MGPKPGGRSLTPAEPPKLLDRVRNTIRLHQYSYQTEKTYVGWIRRYILFHGKRQRNAAGGGGHADVKSTQVYTHVSQRRGNAVRSPLDRGDGAAASVDTIVDRG